MSSLLRRIRKAAKANADEARLIPPKPVYDAQRLTAEELDRINALYAKARSHSQGKELDWSKMSGDGGHEGDGSNFRRLDPSRYIHPMIGKLGLEHTIRREGRPEKSKK